MDDAPADPRIADLVKSGEIRLALFLPQYTETPAGDIEPAGAGRVGQDLLGELAGRLGLALRIIPRPTPPGAVETVNSGDCDVIIIGIEESRTRLVDFTPPIFRFDFAYLVPDGSPIAEAEDVDRPGRRISVPFGHASWMALKRQIEQAEIVGDEVPDKAFALFCDGKADVFALPREQLFDYAGRLPGSRILTEGFGINEVGLAVAKGKTALRDYISDFVREAKAAGLVGNILEETGMASRGFSVAD